MLVTVGFYFVILPEQSWASFPAYVDSLAARDPMELRDRLLTAYAKVPLLATRDDQECCEDGPPVDWDAVLKDCESYLDFLRSRFQAVLQVLEMLSQRLRETDASLAEAHFLDVRSRLAKKIVDLTRAFGVLEEGKIRIGVRITQKDLASMVGATRESINKQLMQMRQLGLVELESGFMTVLDPVRLARRARTDPLQMQEISPNREELE